MKFANACYVILLAATLLQLARANDRSSGPAIEAYVAPPSLFPPEGSYPAGAAAQYRPLEAYTLLDGDLLGHVHTNYRECDNACENPGEAFLVTPTGRRIPLETQEWSYETRGLITYKAPRYRGSSAWSNIKFSDGEFWIKTPKADVHSYESLAFVVDRFDVVCAKPGNCVPLSQKMRADAGKFRSGQIRVLGCYREPYSIVRIVTAGGRRYYQVKLQEVEPQQQSIHLPRSTFIPVRDKRGRHTGTFYSRGC